MSKIKLSDLAKELNVDWKTLAEEIENITGKSIKKSNVKIEEEIADILRMTYGQEEEIEEEVVEEKEEGIKLFDLTHQLNVSFEDIAEALKMIDFKGEISNFTVIDKATVKKVKEALKELERKREEERKKEEEKKKRKKKFIAQKIEEKKEIQEREEKIQEKKEEVKKEVKEVQEKEKKEKPKIEEKTIIEEKLKEKEETKEEQKKKKEKFVKEKSKIKEKPEKAKHKEKEKKEEKVEEVVSKEKTEVGKELTKEEIQERKREKEELEALRKLMEVSNKKKKRKKKKKEEKVKKEEIEEKEEDLKIVEIPELITVRELADLLDLPVNTIMADLLKKGILATVNQTIDPEIAMEIAEEHGFLAELKSEEEVVESKIETQLEEEDKENLVERPPVVVVMGHVDHGKTTLLDTIRKTDVAAREKGGITQHIGAYKIKLKNGKEITFLDTPGHEAFTTLRARGSKVADVAVLVVAADDGVRPQTVEAINHAKSAELPIVVAINKIDKPGADPERVKRELSQYELIPEEWGGDTIMVPVSAKTGQNLDELLENILLVSEILDLKANPNKPAVGTIIESKLDKQRGPVATVLVQNGTLKIGDYFVAGMTWGKVRAMFDERGKNVKEAMPGTPVEILGFQEVPQSGDGFVVMKSEKDARTLAEQRKQKYEEQLLAKKARLRLEALEGAKEINVIIKADVQGSLEAIKKTLEELSEKFEDVSINIIHAGLGGITESDVMLAAASDAIIIGFNVRPDATARNAAEEEGVQIKTYGIIYDIIEDLEKALKGMLEPEYEEKVLGLCDVKAIFKVKGAGTVAGCYVTDGVIKRNAKARLLRQGVVIYDGEIISLKRFKDDVKEVAKGFECGLMLKDFNDIKPGDVIEAYELEEIQREG
ncbi:translation initiation factor IF-2 [Hydrogenothermus marinus]|uniref:Translation initiation factor IF-2 n=1 Tax=Hydrogenothermus marinus TaxID=133270 RepID=A0A3M0C2Z5_9AQUI|nr:translation initiation factor IF-2 [Hydrogenothermus marinus]RMA97322.1 translation initiation factor IF-2 [Hydrogenothermus marinus]